MNLHEAMLDEWDSAFLNLDEFACMHDFGGKRIKCIVSDQDSGAATKAGVDFGNISGVGLLRCDRVVYCHAADLLPQPLPGEKLEMDGQYWLVAESGIGETEGLFRLPLNRAY